MDIVDRKTPTKLSMTQSHNKLSPSQADEASNKPSPARPAPLSIQNLINKHHDKNINNNSTVNNLNHSSNYVKREFNKSEDDEATAASPNRRNSSIRIKDERNGTTAKNGMDHFNRKRSFSMDTSNEIKSNNQSDADIKVKSLALQNVCFFFSRFSSVR